MQREYIYLKKVIMLGFFVLILGRHVCLISIRKVVLSLSLIKPQEAACS